MRQNGESQFRWHERGAGEPVLLLHGLVGEMDHWEASLCALVSPEWVAAVQRMVSTRETALRLLRIARAARCRNIEDRLPAIGVPTCIIWGADDRITPPEVAHRFHALIQGSDLFLLPRCGHAPMLEQPAVFNALVAAWLLRTRPHRLQPACVRGKVP